MSSESTGGPANSNVLNGNETPTIPSTGPKAVTIYDEPEHIPNEPSHTSSRSHSPKMHRANISGKKLTGRPSLTQQFSTSPNLSRTISPTLSRTISYLKLEDSVQPEPSPLAVEIQPPRDDARRLLSLVTEWLNEQKAKRGIKSGSNQDGVNKHGLPDATSHNLDSDQDLALEKLEAILDSFKIGSSASYSSEVRPKKSRSVTSLRHGSIGKAFKRTNLHTASSDTEWVGEDINVPHVEASLDNAKTLAFTGGATDMDDVEAAQQRDLKHWEQFKRDIVRLTHTLKIRGWRRIPIDKGEVIVVERLSGALTNAVYVVKPPTDLPEPDENTSAKTHLSRSKPMDLLLRIYGPQVEHLIDRDVELGILRRLARQKIGPRLLGYFTNGRFEEYFHARTLTAEDLRVPGTAKQIAKRMRELHDGIDLLPSEREEGAQVFKNWDKWVDRCETVTTWLDSQVKQEAEGQEPRSKRYTRWGLVCGVEWPVFRNAFERYRKHLIAECGGETALQEQLVFAHNDTQYGNLMRNESQTRSSTTKQPDNQHRQLIVIDFEYAGANFPGYEFANHFTEWCYNYHNEDGYVCNTQDYPTPEVQHAFVRAYVMHRPQFHPDASSTPNWQGQEKQIPGDFSLDPTSQAPEYDEQERAREQKVEDDIKRLLHETKLWRIANAAHWVAWGIVQAKIPELDEPPKRTKSERITAVLERIRAHVYPQSDPLDEEVKASQEAAKHDRPEGSAQEESHAEGGGSENGNEFEEFDYLGYAQERAMLFWGDCLQMGIVQETELPESLLKRVKMVKY